MENLTLEIGDAPKAIYNRLRDRILTGQLSAGEQIKIQSIAEEMGISTIPVREAIRMLATEGLIELRPRRSPVVATLKLSEILEINTIRVALEPFFLERAVDAHTDESIAHCRALIAADQVSTDFNEKIELNRQFHLALLEPAVQPRALKLIDDQFESLSRYAQMMVMQGASDWRGHVHLEHVEILEAVIARNTAQAVEKLRRHISAAADRVARQLESQTDVEI